MAIHSVRGIPLQVQSVEVADFGGEKAYLVRCIRTLADGKQDEREYHIGDLRATNGWQEIAEALDAICPGWEVL